MAAPPALPRSPSRPSPKQSRRTWKGKSPSAGSAGARRIFSGECAATSSISMPPAWDAITSGAPVSRSTVTAR